MEELKELRFGDNEVALNNNLVKSSILPQSSKELSRNVKIQGNVILEGSVFGNTIEIENGPATFEGAVFANKELHIANDAAGDITFRKAAASSQSIAAFLTTGPAIFGADLNAPSVRLKNCFVGGSIFASEVYLENCVVLGGVFATKSAVISGCIVGTFNSASVELAGVNYILYPACFSVEPMTFLPGTELYNLSLAHLGALYKGDPEAEYTGKIKMDLENDNQRTVLVNDDDTTMTVNSYSVSGRVLAADVVDMEKLENHFLIGSGALGTQILKVYNLQKANGEKSEELTVPNIAAFFFKILSGALEVQDLSGEISFAELRKALE